jgi:hypothetical protein
MGIVFFCQNCGARFEVDARMAGKKGRCKQCGQGMSIPQEAQLVSTAATPALAAAARGAGVSAGGGARAAASAGSGSIASLLREGISKVGLAPLTLDRVPVRKVQPSPLDDAEDSKPYVLADPEAADLGRVTRQDNAVARAWRQQLGGVQKLFRKINETAYLVSVPFLMILLLGTAVRNRPLALFGATVVVLLNIGRLVAGAANLAVIPFREGINLKKMKKPIRRVLEPAFTIGLVILAFVFIPWLSSGQSSKASTAKRVRSGAQALEKDMKGELDRGAGKARALDVDQLGARDRKSLNEPERSS